MHSLQARAKADSRSTDELDDRLITILQEDVRHPVGKIARRLGISTPTVRRRIQKLKDDNILYMGVITDLYAVGYEFLIFCGVKVTGREALSVATDIAKLSDTLTVNLVQGHFDIEAVLATKSKEEIGRLLLHVVASIPGVDSVAPSLALDVWKFQADTVPPNPSLIARKKPQLDRLNLEILDCLQNDARMSMRGVASRLGVTSSTVRARYRQMLDRKQSRLTAVRSQETERAQQVAYLGILVTGGTAADVCTVISALPEISFVATTLGPYDIIACAVMTEQIHLTRLIEQFLPTIPGVRRVDLSHCVENVKYQLELGLVL